MVFGLARQSGVALITVLMVFSIATILVSKLILQRSIDSQRVLKMIDRSQAHYYARVGEDLAILGLRVEDTFDNESNNPNIDTLSEEWTAQPISFEIDSFSEIVIRTVDLNRFYNLNNLLEPSGLINEDELVRFQNMLFELGLDAELADNLADWLDADDSDRGFDTESDSYLRQDLAYRAANRQLYDARELSLVKGFTPEVLETLLPHVTALEIPDILPINVNTASAVVLSILEDSGSNSATIKRKAIGMSGAQRIIDERPYDDRTDFNARSGIRNLRGRSEEPPDNPAPPEGERDRERVVFGSTYFEVNIRTNYSGTTAYLSSVFKQEGVGEQSTYILLKREESDNSARFVEQF